MLVNVMQTDVKEAGDLLGIKVMDHVIVGTDGMVSLLERGVM